MIDQFMRRRLSEDYEAIRHLSDAYVHIYKKKNYPCDFW